MNRFISAILAAALFAAGIPRALAESNVGQPFNPTVQALAYSAGNSLGGLQSVGVGRSTGIFNGLWLASQGGSTVAVTVYIFDTKPSASSCLDRTAAAFTAADTAKLAMAPFTLTPAVVGNGSTVTFAQLLQVVSIRNQDATPQNLFYVCLVANGTVTPASAADLVGKFFIAID